MRTMYIYNMYTTVYGLSARPKGDLIASHVYFLIYLL